MQETYNDILTYTQDYSDLLLQTYRFLSKITSDIQFNWKTMTDKFNPEWNLMCSLDTQCGLNSSFLLDTLADKTIKPKTLEFHTPSSFKWYNIYRKKIASFIDLDKNGKININTPTLFEIGIPSQKVFPGHVVTFVAIPGSTGNTYYCMQSFVHQYTPKLKKLTEDEFILYITNFSFVFRSLDRTGTTTIHKNLWEICTWTPYNDKFSPVLLDTDFYVTITKAPLLTPSQIGVNYIKYLGIGYGIFLTLRFFIKDLFNISNKVCGCKFLRADDFKTEKSKCRELSGDANIDNTIYNKYRHKYPDVIGTRNEIINTFKLYEYISTVFKTKDPEEIVISFNRSFSTDLLDVNSSNTLARLEDFIKRFENSQIKLLVLRIEPYLGEIRRYFLCIFLSVVDSMYDAMKLQESQDNIQKSRISSRLISLSTDIIQNTPDYKNSLSWLQSVSPSFVPRNKNPVLDNYKIFEVISIVEFISNNIYPDIKYFFLNITQGKFVKYISEQIIADDDISKYFRSVIDKYNADNDYQTFISGFSHDTVLSRFSSSTILNFYFDSCDYKGNNNEKLSSFLVNFVDQPESYQNNVHKILLLASTKFVINIT